MYNSITSHLMIIGLYIKAGLICFNKKLITMQSEEFKLYN